ncbi:MAG: hypothetical protein ABSD20_03135, partial [Terriglobales bacterium]
MRLIAIDCLAGLLFVAGWYFWFSRYNRRRASEILNWVERAFHGHGASGSVRWTGASRFFIFMHFPPTLFQRASLAVRLFPREAPISWLLSRLRHERETLTFQADLDTAPGFELEVQNHRWYGRTRRRFPPKEQNWIMEQAGPYVLTTRNDWQREITNMMNALLASRECDCLTVCFRRSSPH